MVHRSAGCQAALCFLLLSLPDSLNAADGHFFRDLPDVGSDSGGDKDFQGLTDRLKQLEKILLNRELLLSEEEEEEGEEETGPYAGHKKLEIMQQSRWTNKRDFSALSLVSPVCPSRRSWTRIVRANDIDDTEVLLFQQPGSRQYFYTTECDFERGREENPACSNCCRGINTNRYSSQCLTTKSFVRALARSKLESTYNWKWIQINTGCACGITLNSG